MFVFGEPACFFSCPNGGWIEPAQGYNGITCPKDIILPNLADYIHKVKTENHSLLLGFQQRLRRAIKAHLHLVAQKARALFSQHQS